jgi:hypothetical protein
MEKKSDIVYNQFKSQLFISHYEEYHQGHPDITLLKELFEKFQTMQEFKADKLALINFMYFAKCTDIL